MNNIKIKLFRPNDVLCVTKQVIWSDILGGIKLQRRCINCNIPSSSPTIYKYGKMTDSCVFEVHNDLSPMICVWIVFSQVVWCCLIKPVTLCYSRNPFLKARCFIKKMKQCQGTMSNLLQCPNYSSSLLFYIFSNHFLYI